VWRPGKKGRQAVLQYNTGRDPHLRYEELSRLLPLQRLRHLGAQALLQVTQHADAAPGWVGGWVWVWGREQGCACVRWGEVIGCS
jgi:hypothetical protein